VIRKRDDSNPSLFRKDQHMRTLAYEEQVDPVVRRPSHAEMLRQWSSPRVILVVTDLRDEESLQFHAIQQARQSGAKVLLVEVDENATTIARTRHLRGVLPFESFRNSRGAAERMADRIRRAGIPCESVIIRGLRAEEVPAIARSSGADRVLVSAPGEHSTGLDRPALAEAIISGLNLPVCIVGRNRSALLRYQRPSRRISLVLSLRARNDTAIAFSSLLAREIHSQLTIMTVIPTGVQGRPGAGDVQAAFISHLPPGILKEAGLVCPIDFSVIEGNPATEILNYECSLKQDCLVLAPPRDAGPIGCGMSAVYRILREAQCPVFVLSEHPATPDENSDTAGAAREVDFSFKNRRHTR
jgi:nucleotide-binding universal stress UspA family protein